MATHKKLVTFRRFSFFACGGDKKTCNALLNLHLVATLTFTFNAYHYIHIYIIYIYMYIYL